MGLDESCLSYLEKLIAVRPVYGWGWSRLDAPEIPVPDEIDGVPFPFHFRISGFLYFENELRGAVGIIEEGGHIYNNLWAFFYNRVTGTFNFTSNLPYCNVEIGATYPTLRGEWFEFTSGSPIVSGYCIVGASLNYIEESPWIGTKNRLKTAGL